ncbi:nucleoside-diphosphate-sugar epimerase [Desulfitobacterium dehalogenans ATCC 51507]|uniref:Nucleoside-diphosphate-sugar epimerase n=1 Tax=Desulfitobacterium dehalogenans (strain ATCC 51507 / DSM 9161 / JW/IU-DC1) TaxID=756499 RepID=I4ABU9_DESDJ|nr:NAD-dependent epimerase/dehydratase family protein [Desulfitobacterium dehalogenans]AFM01434.1 nucleoside-diphosphate-sugar epimerase [Desulfitobacterium dehalogenans ATCC 51507]
MKVLVTGGAGFIGSHLVESLVCQGIEVSIIDNLVSGQSCMSHPLVAFHHMDICSRDAKAVIIREKPDVVFHLAAQTDVRKSLQDPQYDAKVNICGTINLLEACREAKVRKLIFTSTSAVYGDLHKEPISEEDPVAPISYYGLSKWAAESYILLFHQLYGISYTILRFSNVYGPGQIAKGEGGVVAVFLDHIHAKKTLNIHGDGAQTRDFVYVKDVVRAIQAAVERGDQEIIQVSSSGKTSVNQLVSMLSRIHGSAFEIIHTPANQGDVKHSCLDNRKAYELLQWQPLIDLPDGLATTYAYSKNKIKGDSDIATTRFERNVRCRL